MKSFLLIQALYCALFSLPKTRFKHTSQRRGFSLVEMLMTLLVASLLLAALAPVMTKRMNENMHITGEFSNKGASKIVDIEYGGKYCSNIIRDDKGNELYCEGEYIVEDGFNNITVTAIGGGGGGGTAPTSGYIEYKTAGSSSFVVPVMTDGIEATLVGGGAGGGAGWIDTNITGYAWTFSGALDRNYVTTSHVSENVKNIKVSGSSVSTNYAHGEAVLNFDDTKYIANGKMFVSLSGGGGGGGQGTVGTGGGGGGTYHRYGVTITNGTSYPLKVGTGGKARACNGNAGCGGAISQLAGVIAGGGGGGGWSSMQGAAKGGSASENGVAGSQVGSKCTYTDGTVTLQTGGGGCAPGGLRGETPPCVSTVSQICTPGGNGGGSIFGAGGIYSTIASRGNRHGQGYGAGGCGSGVHNCSSYPGVSAISDEFTGNGAPGFVAAEWHQIANGGGGGGGGAIVPEKRVDVSPNETLTVIVGEGGKGGSAGYVNSLGNITSPKSGFSGIPSILKRGNTELIRTSADTGTDGSYCEYGGCLGDTKGYCGFSGAGCAPGWVYNGYNKQTGVGDRSGGTFSIENGHLMRSNTNFPNYKVYGGNAAGNNTPSTSDGIYKGALTSSDGGGNGGGTLIDNVKTCTAGLGSTEINNPGGNATGYGGCGGGGGYGVTNGGDGVCGYGKILWNPDKKGAGGGGASGNIIKETVRVGDKQVIKIRIGAGGAGAKVANNIIIPSASGGTTIFGDPNFIEIKAGGGGGGGNPYIQDGKLVNGKGGLHSNVCQIGSRNYLNNINYCTKGAAGGTSASKEDNSFTGGLGAAFTYTIKDKTYIGKGGNGGMQSTEAVNSKGKNAEGIASGGGGAAVLIYNQANSSSFLEHPQGGSGANGKIILELWE